MTATDTVTIVFTDLVGSTALAGRLGDDAADALRHDFFDLLGDAARSTGGDVIKTMGDGMMVAYGAAADAVAGAVAMQQALHERNRSVDERLDIRVGASTGDAVREDDDWFGAPVVEAARLCDLADAGQILVADVVRMLAGTRGGHQFTRLGPRSLKGVAEPVDVCEVIWTPTATHQLPLPSPLSRDETVPLVGRSEDVARLVEGLEKVRSGASELAFLRGEPGIGKTRLATEFARRAHDDGAVVLFGRCDEEPLASYQPFVEALGHYASHAATSELRRVVGRDGAALSDLIPGLSSRIPIGAEAAHADPGTDRYRLFEAVTDLLRRVSASAPVVLLLDDVHWADKPTLLLLRHVVVSEPGRVHIIATYRDSEVGRTHPLGELLADLGARGGAQRMTLRGLSESNVGELVESVAGQSLDASARTLVGALHDATDGSPLFLRELLRHLVETGDVSRVGGRWNVETVITSAGLPEGIKDVIGRRLSRLSDDNNDALTMAAVIGREFDLRLLARLTDLDEDRLLGLLEAAASARIIHEVEGALDRFAFTHALVRETLLDELTTSRRLRLHRRIGEVLEDLHGADIDSVLPQLAYHFSEASAGGATSQAIAYLRRAAAAANDVYAFEEAVGYLSTALDLAGRIDPPDPELRIRVMLELAGAERRGSGRGAGHERFRSALDEARAIAAPELIARATLGLLDHYPSPGHRDDDELALLEGAVAGLGEGVPDGLHAALLTRLSIGLYYADVERSRGLVRTAIDLARAAGDDEVLAYALWGWRWHLISSPDMEERELVSIEVTRLANASKDSMLKAFAFAGAIENLLAVGATAEARRLMTEYAALIDAVGTTDARYFWALLDAMFATHDGRLEEAESKVFDAVAIGQELEDPIVMNQFAGQLYSLRLEQGRLGELEPVFDSMRVSEPEIEWDVALPLVYAESGQLERVEPLLDEVMERIDTMPRDGNFPIFVGLLAFAASIAGTQRHAATLLDLARPYEHIRITVGAPCSVGPTGAAAVASLSLLLGRTDDAIEFGLAALAADQRAGARCWEARTHYWLARAYLARDAAGDSERADEHVTACRELAEDIGMAGVLRDVAALASR